MIPENPMPEAPSNLTLAEDFSAFIHDKIAWIRDALQTYDRFVPLLVKEGTGIFREFQAVNNEMVNKVIHSLPPKSCELDALPARIFRQCVPYILDFLTILINKTLQMGSFIEGWKTSIYKLLIKGQNLPTTFKSYRLVSNIPFLSKVVEKVVLAQFQNHCNTNDLFPLYQSAYRQNFSCETSIAWIMVDLLQSFEDGKATAMLFMDLSAAFDTVDHGILSQVLSHTFNVQGTCLSWLETYLSPCWTKVYIGNDYSPAREIDCSVPQGSCLGPILYASTLKDEIPDDTDIHGYADDHAVKSTFTPGIPGQEELTLMSLSSMMDKVDIWMKKNRLKLNLDKTEFIIFASKALQRKCILDGLMVSGSRIDRSPCVKHLGVLLDQSLTMKAQVSRVCQAAMVNYLRV